MMGIKTSLFRKFLYPLFGIGGYNYYKTTRPVKRYEGEEKKKNGQIDEEIVNFLGIGSSLVGDIETKTDLRIDGSVIGNISTSKTLVVGAKGEILGNISAAKIVCSGRIQGDFHSATTTSIEATGYYEGILTTKSITIATGACVVGKILTVGKTSNAYPRPDIQKYINFQSELQLNYPRKTV